MNKKTYPLLSFINDNKTSFIFSIVFLVLSSFVPDYIQKIYYCRSETSCQFWGALPGYLLLNGTVGWIVCYFVSKLIYKEPLSALLKLTLPVAFLLYFLGHYYFFGYYSLILNDETLISSGSTMDKPIVLRISDIESLYFKESHDEYGTHYNYYAKMNDLRNVPLQTEPAVYMRNTLGLPTHRAAH